MIRKFIVLIIFLVFVWLIWSSYGRNHPLSEPESFLSKVQVINPSDSLERTLIGMQPYMHTSDYLDGAVFKQKLRGYFQAAYERGLFKKQSIVLLPEYIGTWLVIDGEKHILAKKESLAETEAIFISSNLAEFGLSIMNTGDEEDWKTSAIFRMKAKRMALTYYTTFADLAREYHTYIVAGSIVLPGPTVVDGQLYVDLNEPLRNASFLFDPDGKIVGKPTFKAFPTAFEQSFTTGIELDFNQTYEIPFSKAAISISTDSWFAESYANARKQQADLILAPAISAGSHNMTSFWQGYNGYQNPSTVDLADIGKITGNQAWKKYALPAQISQTSAQAGMAVFLRGEFWDLGTDGSPIVMLNNELLEVEEAEKGGIWALNY